jgi:hypothetical protein
MGFRLRVAMGDPQAPLATVRAVLDGHGLLGADGWLRPEVQLVSMGDHFDWGTPAQRRQATEESLALLRWLAAHPAEQVVLLAGNHDVARVCELQPFADDAAFEEALGLAQAAYRGGDVDETAERALLSRYPHVPDAECLARDFSCFSVAQRDEVTRLLRGRRLRLAHACDGLLLVHAGVTRDDFALLGSQPTSAEEAAALLNAFLDARVAAWGDGPLDLSPLHRPGTAATGEARGVLFQRPAFPGDAPRFSRPPRRRFDPRALPSTFPQAIGHVRDKKCLELLGPWAAAGPAEDGPLRALCIDGEAVRYQRGTPREARLYFLDAGMRFTTPDRYELFDLHARAPLSRRRSW